MGEIETASHSLERLRIAGRVYVDKADMMWRFVSDAEGGQFSASRPKRFGKAFMRPPLKCIFKARMRRAGWEGVIGR